MGYRAHRAGDGLPLLKLENQAECERVKEIVSRHPQQRQPFPIKRIQISISKSTLVRFCQQQGIKCQGGRLNVFGLLDVQHGCLRSYTTQESVDTTQMIEWLDDFAKTLAKPTVVVLDNPWHKSESSWHNYPDGKTSSCSSITFPLTART